MLRRSARFRIDPHEYAMLQPAAAAANWKNGISQRKNDYTRNRTGDSQGQIHKGANTAELCAIIVDEAYVFDVHLVHLPISIRTVKPIIE